MSDVVAVKSGDAAGGASPKFLTLSGVETVDERSTPASSPAVRRRSSRRSKRKERRRKTIVRSVVLALCVIGAALAWWLTRGDELTMAATVVYADTQLYRGTGRGAPRVRAGDSVVPGEVIETRGESRASFRGADNSSLRVSFGTVLVWDHETVIRLQRGTLYADVPKGARSLEVRTTLGTVSATGAQLEVRLQDELRVRVRSGSVLVRRGGEQETVSAGAELAVTEAGFRVNEIVPYAAEWAWASELAPKLNFDGMRLAAYLQATAREQGWAIEYADADTAAVADRAVMAGSVDGLSAVDAVGVAVNAANLSHQLIAGRLYVVRSPEKQ